MSARRSLGRELRGWSTPRSSAGTLVLDLISSPAFAAFSLSRKLRSAYSGAAFRVRRASDSTQSDIGFAGNVYDASALASFCSGTTGYVVKVYDQSPIGADASASGTSNQPRIYASGAVSAMSNGKVAMYYPNSAGVEGLLTPTSMLGFSGDPALTVGFAFARQTGEDRLWQIGTSAAQSDVALDAEVSRGMFLSNYGGGGGSRQLSYTTTASLPHAMIFKKASGGAISAWDIEEGGTNLTQTAISNGTQHCNLASNARVALGNFTTLDDSLNGWIAAWIGFNALLSGTDLTTLRTEMANYA
jgi:alpha-L-arabinofuranosidase B-like protein